MNIALVSTDFLPNIGGVAQHVAELAKAHLRHGHSVEVIAPSYSNDLAEFGKPPGMEETMGIPVWRIPLVINRSIRFVTGQITSRLSDRRFTKELLGRLHQTTPDIVHWHSLESRGHPLAEWRRTAKVWTNHTSHFIVGLSSHRRSYYKRCAELADAIIAPSEELCDLTASLGVPRERLHFISNGVDSRRFTPNQSDGDWRERLALKPADRLILCPRRLEKKNGVSYFIQSAIQLLEQGVQDVHFAVAGNFSGPKADSEEEIVVRMVNESRFRHSFHLLGRVENPDMPALYASSYLVAMPSLMEATSLSAMEAMAAAKAVVSTDVGGLPFLIRDGENGVLVPPQDVGRMADAIKSLLDNPDRAQQFGVSGRSRVERELDWSAISGKTIEVYKSAITNFSPDTSSHLQPR